MEIAYQATWDVALSANELAALNAGVDPIDIRTGNLISYIPLDGYQSPEPDDLKVPVYFSIIHEATRRSD